MPLGQVMNVMGMSTEYCHGQGGDNGPRIWQKISKIRGRNDLFFVIQIDDDM
jgi:hypothetical protein